MHYESQIIVSSLNECAPKAQSSYNTSWAGVLVLGFAVHPNSPW